MRELCSSPYFGIALSVLAFGIGVKLNEKLKTPVCNPLVIAIVLIVGVLLIFKIPYEDYNAGGKIINMFLAPATACLAVAIYTKIQILKQYWLPILVGCTAGSLASMGSVYGLCRLFVTAVVLVRVPGAYLTSKWFPTTLLPMGLATAAGSLLSVIICLIAFLVLRRHGRLVPEEG